MWTGVTRGGACARAWLWRPALTRAAISHPQVQPHLLLPSPTRPFTTTTTPLLHPSTTAPLRSAELDDVLPDQDALDEEADPGTEYDDDESLASLISGVAEGPKDLDALESSLPEPIELTEHVLQMKRSVKVTSGGRNIRYKALVVVGDENGRGGFGYASGMDSKAATDKSHITARRTLMKVPLWRNRSLYHDVRAKYNSTKVMIRRAPFGSGLKAGRTMYLMCNAIGIKDAVCKIWGSTNEINVVRATFLALAKARSLQDDCNIRGLDHRRFVQPEDDVMFDDTLYRGGSLTMVEAVGRDSKEDFRATIDDDEELEFESFLGVDGPRGPDEPPLPEPEPNPKFELWDVIAEENERSMMAWAREQLQEGDVAGEEIVSQDGAEEIDPDLEEELDDGENSDGDK